MHVLLQCDQVADGQVCHPPDMEAYCKEKGYVAWFETSAKENINIDEAARFLISRVSRCSSDQVSIDQVSINCIEFMALI